MSKDGAILSRNDVIRRIRTALKKRSGKAWSVAGGRGTAWGWIRITAPPRRQIDGCRMSDEDRTELAKLLGLDRPVHFQGVGIPDASDYYQEHIDRAEGREPSVIGKPYWD